MDEVQFRGLLRKRSRVSFYATAGPGRSRASTVRLRIFDRGAAG